MGSTEELKYNPNSRYSPLCLLHTPRVHGSLGGWEDHLCTLWVQ